MNKIVALFIFLVGHFAEARLVQCGVEFKYGSWEDTAGVKILDGPDAWIGSKVVKLADKKTFSYGISSGALRNKEVITPHNGVAPEPLRDLEFKLEFVTDPNIGWPGHDRSTVTLTLFNVKTNKVVIGPLSASSISETAVAKKSDGPAYLPSLSFAFDYKEASLAAKVKCGGDHK